jgi:hypothetical protein
MGTLIPFKDDMKLPAYLRGKEVDNTGLTSNVSAGFPYLSLKGKVWTLIRDGEKTILTRPNDPDEPTTSVEVVILGVNPHLSKSYYGKQYVEGSQDKPICYSNDGKTPAADSTDRQSKTCAACPHNVWGSGQNAKGRACPDFRRLAVAPAGNLDDPMLLRVPAASLKPMAEYAGLLTKRGLPYRAVVTRLRFDPAESTPKLVPTVRAILDEEAFEHAIEVSQGDLVKQIIAEGVALPDDDSDGGPAQEAPAKPARTRAKPAPVPDDDEDEAPAKPARAKAKPAPAVEDEDEDEAPAKPARTRAKAKLAPVPDDDEDEAPAKPARTRAKPAPVVEAEDEDEDEAPAKAPKAKISAELDDILGDLDDFDA